MLKRKYFINQPYFLDNKFMQSPIVSRMVLFFWFISMNFDKVDTTIKQWKINDRRLCKRSIINGIIVATC